MSSASRAVSFGLLGGLAGAVVMGLIALMMPVPMTGGAPFFVAAAMQMGMGSMSEVAGWALHLFTGAVIGTIFGVAVAKVSILGLRTRARALGLGALAGAAAFFVWFMPMMAMTMPALMGMSSMVAGGFAAHIVFGLVLGGVASLAVPKVVSAFRCPSCGAAFGTKEELMEHGKVHMSSNPAQQFKCPACGATFSTQQGLMEHGKKSHPM